MTQYDPEILSELTPYERQLLLTKPPQLSSDQKVERRKLQNRIASISSRQKKAKHVGSLEETTQTLQDELDESKLVNRILAAQVNELLTILSRSNAFESQSNNDSNATTTPNGIGYEASTTVDMDAIISVADFGLKDQLLAGLALFSPQQGLLSSPYLRDQLHAQQDFTNGANASAVALAANNEANGKRTTRSQIAAAMVTPSVIPVPAAKSRAAAKVIKVTNPSPVVANKQSPQQPPSPQPQQAKMRKFSQFALADVDFDVDHDDDDQVDGRNGPVLVPSDLSGSDSDSTTASNSPLSSSTSSPMYSPMSTPSMDMSPSVMVPLAVESEQLGMNPLSLLQPQQLQHISLSIMENVNTTNTFALAQQQHEFIKNCHVTMGDNNCFNGPQLDTRQNAVF